jgi:cellulose synthase/poly-beta-1,6-N-acetylglucosamine synthase-like glycosyltransferase
MDARADVSVLVPVLDEQAGVERCLASALSQRLEGTVEVLVLDGGSRDATRAIVARVARADPRVRLLDNPRGRIPCALNLGLAAARGEFVARMDAHTVYPATYLADGVQRLRDGGVVWVSGPAIARGEGVWSRRVALALSTRLGVGGARFRTLPAREVDVDAGFTGVWRRDVLLAHGGWDEDWPVNEDGELAGRIRGAGGRIVCLPEMAASYAPRDSLPALARQYWRYGRYRAKTSRRHPHSMRRSHLLAPGLVATMAAAPLLRGAPGRVARTALAAYPAAVLLAAVQTARAGRATPRDAAAVPLVLATMHVAWGGGFLAGAARFGPPLRALAPALAPRARREDRWR